MLKYSTLQFNDYMKIVINIIIIFTCINPALPTTHNNTKIIYKSPDYKRLQFILTIYK